MPSVASSLNDAGQKSLLDVMQQRILQAEMQKLLFAQQRQQKMDDFNMTLRTNAAGRSARQLELSEDAARRADEKAKADAARQATDDRAKLNKDNAASMFFEGLTRNPNDRSPGLMHAAQQGGVPVSMLPQEPDEPLADRLARIAAETTAREKAQAPFDIAREARAEARRTGAEKIGKDDPQLPARFRSVIRQRRGTKGFENRKAAVDSLFARWPEWLQNYPELDASKVKSELENIFGPELSSNGGVMLSTPDDMERRKANVAAKVDGLQNYR